MIVILLRALRVFWSQGFGVSCLLILVSCGVLLATEKTIGVFGSPKALWRKGRKLTDLGANAVFVSANELNQSVVREVRKEGAKVYVEVTVFAGKKVAESRPELWPIGADGNKIQPEEWYLGLCPSNETYRKERLSRISHLLDGFSIDGIWLDFIRYPVHWESPQPKLYQSCFCDRCLGRFERDKKIALKGVSTREKADEILKKHKRAWTEWKISLITDFVKAAKEIIKQRKAKALLGAFTLPWTEEDFNNAITEIAAQDFVPLAQYIDVFSPMVYHKMVGRDIKWIGSYTNYLRRKTGKSVWPIIQAVDQPQKVSTQEFSSALDEAFKASSSGVIVFKLSDIVSDKEKEEAFRARAGTR